MRRTHVFAIALLFMAFVSLQSRGNMTANVGVSPVAAFAQAATNVPALGALDYFEIQNLYGRNSLAFDAGLDRGEQYARTFTADGSGVDERGALVGRDRLAAFAAGAERGFHTWITNLTIEPSPEGAIGWPYVTKIDAAQGLSAGQYRDVIVKTADGWRLKNRTFTPGNRMPKGDSFKGAAASSAPEASAGAGLTPLDYTDIKRLVGQYNLGWDNAAPWDGGELVGRSFTPDATFQTPGPTPWIGRAEIARRAGSTQPGFHHWVSNHLVDASPDGGATGWYLLFVARVGDAGQPVSPDQYGVILDRYTRTRDGWQVSSRKFEPLGSTPSVTWPSPQRGQLAASLPADAKSRSRAGVGLTPADYVAIEQLYARNNIALDSVADDGKQYARTFTADGLLSVEGVNTTGHAALAELVKKNSPDLRTWTFNQEIEPSREGASGWAYVMKTEWRRAASGAQRARPSITGVGLYRDELVKTRDGWRFKSRRYTTRLTPALLATASTRQ